MKELTEVPGVVGDESEARKVMENHIKPFADEIHERSIQAA